jgi:hypothetical protein
MDGLHLTEAAPEHQVDFVLGVPVSEGVLEGRSARLGLDVIQRPDIILDVNTDFHR